MKNVLLASFILAASLNVFAQSEEARTVDEVRAVEFSDGSDGIRTVKITYGTGGCDPEENNPKLNLEHVSTTDITPKWAIDRDPKTLREYRVVMKIVVKETPGSCMMAYDMDVSGNLSDLFKAKAPELGIDLGAKKAFYSVEFKAPQAIGYTHFSAQ